MKSAEEARREYMREWAKRHAEERREYNRQWQRANPEKVRAAHDRYWNKKAAEMAAGTPDADPAQRA